MRLLFVRRQGLQPWDSKSSITVRGWALADAVETSAWLVPVSDGGSEGTSDRLE